MSEDEEPTAPREPAQPGLRGVGLAVAIALVAVAAWRFRPRASTAPARADASVARPLRDASVVDVPVDVPRGEDVPAAGAAELAILEPLRAGAPLGDGRIERVSRVFDGRILIEVSRGATRVTLAVMLHNPALDQLFRAGRYAVYIHSSADPSVHNLVPRVAAALELHQDAPVPEGLRPADITPGVEDAGRADR